MSLRVSCRSLTVNVQHTAQIERSSLVSLVNSTISWAQLERGQLDVAFQVVAVPPFIISLRSLNLACQVTAKVERARAALVLIESHRPGARWFGQEVTNAHIALNRDELDLRTTGASNALGIAVDEGLLQSYFSDAPDAADVFDGLQRNRVSHDAVGSMRLRKIVRSVCSWRALPAPSVTGSLIPLLAETLRTFDSYSVQPTELAKRRFAAVRACEQYMRENLDKTVTMLDLSRYSGMRSRSLINAFEAITGYSPMDYLKRLRLSQVRRALLRADRSSTRIVNVAMDWGFWHMGHFSNDYRTMFGESPSQTLLK